LSWPKKEIFKFASPNQNVRLEQKCLEPGVFAGIVLENFGATALGCMICKNQELDDDSCVAILQTALAVPITLMPATAIAVFKQCTPGCPWGSGDESAVV